MKDFLLLLMVVFVAVVFAYGILHRDYELVEMNVSAYCKEACCCGEWADGVTASGEPARGLLIAAPPKYPFGTLMDVPGYGELVRVLDRGGAIVGNKIDLFFEDKDGISGHQRALNWGRKDVLVKVYKGKN